MGKTEFIVNQWALNDITLVTSRANELPAGELRDGAIAQISCITSHQANQ